MPKQKSHSGAGKRFRITGTGKVMCRQGGASHLMSSKTGKRRRHLTQTTQVVGKKARTIKHFLSG